MRHILLFFGLATCILLSQTPPLLENYIQITGVNPDDISQITTLASIQRVEGDTVLAYASSTELIGLHKYGYTYEILPHPNTLFEPIMARSLEELREWDFYPTYEQFNELMLAFETDYPDLCRVEVMGQSVQGRDILIAKISDNVDSEEVEPEFYYTGQMHGNEVVSFITMLHFIDHLLVNYGEDDYITHLVDEMEIWINPLANPDGTYMGGNHTISGAIRYNANGVDLNRNFPDWISGPTPDGNPLQVENIHQMDFADANSLVLSANIHSGAEVFNYPWDTTPDPTADEDWWEIVGHTYADTVQSYAPWNYFNEFDDGVTQGYDWYETNGNRQDYMNYYKHCREMTLELSDVQMIPANQLLDHWEWNRAALLNYMAEALTGVRGLVTGPSGEPLYASITIPNHDMDESYVVTDPDVGDYVRMLAPGIYDFLYESYGYFPLQVNGITITLGSTLVRDVTLEAQTPFQFSGSIMDSDTGLPVANASVELIDVPEPTVFSDDNGLFVFPTAYEGSYTCRVYAEGYAVVMEEINISSENPNIDFSLEPSTAISFEGGTFPEGWQTFGHENWVLVTDTAADGLYSARSGDIHNDEYSRLEVYQEIADSGFVRFWVQISCEDDEDDNWDYLAFEIDDVEIARWDGEMTWREVSYPVTPGLHLFSWVYDKDGSVSHYQDAGWIDYIQFPNIELTTLPGDVNFDSALNVVDIILLVGYILNSDTPTPLEFLAADMDENGILNVMDIIILVGIIVGN